LKGESGAAINVPLSDQERLTYEVETVPRSGGSPGRILESRFNLDDIHWLRHHRVREVPTVPGAWILDQLVKAASKVALKSQQIGAVTAEDIAFRRFLRFPQHDATPPRVVAIQQADEVAVWMLADLRHPGGTLLNKDVVLAQARFRFHDAIDHIPELEPLPVASPTADPLLDPYCGPSNGLVKLSGPFDCLRDIRIENRGRQARFVPPTCCNKLGMPQTPALLLDATWRIGAMYAQPNNFDLFVPVHIKRITMPFAPGDSMQQLTDCTIRSIPPRVDRECAYWSRSEVRDSSGRLQIVVENATAKRMA
jgi:hypothetical protein